MHGSPLWKYEQKGQEGPPFHGAEETATSGVQGETAKISQVDALGYNNYIISFALLLLSLMGPIKFMFRIIIKLSYYPTA